MFPKISVHQDLNRRRIAWVEFHQTSKAGPNGKKAL
jgi:hypothetical protein